MVKYSENVAHAHAMNTNLSPLLRSGDEARAEVDLLCWVEADTVMDIIGFQ